jgi:uncharacterized protein (DUF2252 family)
MSFKDAYNYGKNCRERASRIAQGEWKPRTGRPNPCELIRNASTGRLPALLPIKLERMSESAFGFFRGATSVMASDLAGLPRSGIMTQICGDAHVRNLGAYSAPDGRLIFDINDFDETIYGPWEWDVKRLATSLVLAGREAHDSTLRCKQAVGLFVRTYREFMHRFSEMSVLDLARYQVHRLLQGSPVAGVLRKAEKSTPHQNLEKFAVKHRRGGWRFQEAKPLLFHVPAKMVEQVLASLASYRQTLSADRRHFLDRYHPVDVAFKVVGTGSVGVRDHVILAIGRNDDDPLFLQVKEEPPSCYSPYLKNRAAVHQGQRVVEGQRLLQAQSDVFLGWTSIAGRDYLVRQLSDHKATIEIDDLRRNGLLQYAEVCGEVLAKGHARAGDACMISGYMGASEKFDAAITAFAVAYANQTAADHQKFVSLVKQGRF